MLVAGFEESSHEPRSLPGILVHRTPELRAMFRAVLVAAILLGAATQRASAQAILENDELRLELIGLKRWTIPMIEDSLRRYAPNDRLLSHACAGVLREKLGFADASVVYHSTTMNGKAMKTYLAVTVIEPQDSGLVQYRGAYRDSLPARRAWAPVRAVFEKHNIAFQGVVQNSDILWSDAPLRAADSALTPALPLRRFLRTHHSPQDRRLALATLATDGNELNRVAAVVLLANFAESDSAWWALTEALRDPVASVSATAAHVLMALSRRAPHRVRWAPATQTLRTILDGTNLFAHSELMEVLAATQIDSALARPLLKDGGYIVLAKLRSQGMAERQASRRFLVQVSGHDLGDAPERWSEWVRGL
jgi:hypothetical protein